MLSHTSLVLCYSHLPKGVCACMYICAVCTCTRTHTHVHGYTCMYTHVQCTVHMYYLRSCYTCTVCACTCVLYMHFMYACTHDACAHTRCAAVRQNPEGTLLGFPGPGTVSRTGSSEAGGARVPSLPLRHAGRACREQSAQHHAAGRAPRCAGAPPQARGKPVGVKQSP